MAETKEYDGSGTLILSPKELKVGMFVSYLDRPWADSPFPFQGFRIEDESELAKLRDVCDYVFVDGRRQGGGEYQEYFARQRKAEAEPAATAPVPSETTQTEKEFPRARKAHSDLRTAMISVYEYATAGRLPDLTELERAVRAVVESVNRNPDALLYMVRTQTDGDYLFRHGVACAVMLCVLGRHMKMSYKSLKTLALGGTLLDIGKTRVPQELLNRPSALELSPGEIQQLRRHVERGAEIISQITSEGDPLVTMIMTHHERFNGKGYPRGLAGEMLPRFGRMAAIVDMFDAMVSERSYGRRATPYEAMRYLQTQRGEDFDPALVNSFRDCFGTYPTGTLVELSNGEVGFVIQQNPAARLQPRVYLLLDGAKQRINEYRVYDLLENKTTCVQRSLKPGSYGIDY